MLFKCGMPAIAAIPLFSSFCLLMFYFILIIVAVPCFDYICRENSQAIFRVYGPEVTHAMEKRSDISGPGAPGHQFGSFTPGVAELQPIQQLFLYLSAAVLECSFVCAAVLECSFACVRPHWSTVTLVRCSFSSERLVWQKNRT